MVILRGGGDSLFFHREKGATGAAVRYPHRARFTRVRQTLFTLFLLGIAGGAFAATGSCDYATGQGSGPADFAKYCWIDFSGYNDSAARSAAGEDFTIALPQGTLTFNLHVGGGGFTSSAVPTWNGAAFGNSAFTGVPGRPALYQTTSGTTTTFTLSNIVVHVSAGELPYTFVAADAESTNAGETLTFNTSGNAWSTLAQMPNGTTYPALSGTGTQTVQETGTYGGTVGAYAFASAFPANQTIGSVSATLVGAGLQGAVFGIKYHAADMSIASTHTPSDFPLGGTGTYTLTAHNNGPDKNHWGSGDATTVTDTLPSGLSFVSAAGTDWTCGVSGQVVTCTSPDSVASGADMNPITLSVKVAGNAPASVTNTATVSNPYNFNTTNDTASDPTPILRSKLSTSTKTVVDTNGGDTNPGDTLEYTVTVNESNGVPASNVSVIDDMPAGVTNFNVVSTPTGSTDTSSATGGANGNGQLNIGNISVPANGSVSIVYDVTVSAGDTPGQTINNTATITDPDGTGASPAAPTVTVSQTQIPVTGNKQLYVLDNASLTRTPPVTAGNGAVTINNGAYNDWTLTGPLQKNLTITANSTVSAKLQVRCQNNFFGGRCFFGGGDFNVKLYDSNNGTLAQIGTTSANTTFTSSNYNLTTANINVGNAVTVPAGHRLVLRVTNVPTRGRGNGLSVEQYNNGVSSKVDMRLSTVINVDSLNTYSSAYPATSTPSVNFFQPGQKVYIRAVVSDPFGSFDVDPSNGGTAPLLTLTAPDGSTALSGQPMSLVNDSGAATKTFEYAYTLPASAPAGYWTPSVTAWEGTEHTVSDTRNSSFDVRNMPNLLILKSVSVLSDPTGDAKPHALPGAIMQYNIDVTNQGQGTADNNTVVLTDKIPPHLSFIIGSTTFSDGSPPSTLTLPSSAIEYCSNGTCPYTSSVTAGNPDPNVTEVIYKPQGVFAGKAKGGAAPGFTIHYKAELQ